MDTSLGEPAKERPSIKVYLGVLAAIVILVAFYFVVSQSFTQTPSVNTPAAAQATTNNIQSGVGDITNDLNSIDSKLGTG